MSGKLDLGLVLNETLTMPGRAVPLLNRKGEVRGGKRSAYDVRTDNYRALFDNRILSAPLSDSIGSVPIETETIL